MKNQEKKNHSPLSDIPPSGSAVYPDGNEKKCSKCGSKIQKNLNVCSICGEKIDNQ